MDRRLFPYVHGRLIVSTQPGPPVRVGLRPVGGANEYLVLTGILMWIPSLVSDSPDTYLLASAVVLAPFGLATAWMLGRMTGRRALWWTASPILVLYAFHNWDLAVVAASVAGFWCWWRGRPMATALCSGIGGALKLYPLLFLLASVLERIHEGDRRGAVRVGGRRRGLRADQPPLRPAQSVRLGGRVSLPGAPQTQRRQPLGGPLDVLFELDQRTITTLSSLAVIAALIVAALLTSFLLVAKVHSPQYALWLVPLFVLVRIRVGWYVLFVAGNVILYVVIFAVSTWSIHARDVLVTWSVWGRAATFLLLVIVFLRAPPALPRVPDPGENDALTVAPAD